MNQAIFIILLALTATNSFSKELGFSTETDDSNIILKIIEKKAIHFPELLFNRATTEGAYCSATGLPNLHDVRYSLCPHEIGQPGVFDVIGAENAIVIVTHSADHTVNGLRLTSKKQNPLTIQTMQLGPTGKAQYIAQSTITLVDKKAVKTSEYNFIFDIFVAYQ
ncbi:hypothetical protein [Marinomonas sp. 2405UD68-3]|uniref:hypothetical protein n=1 Tax=Marinomonas sp. 2405UD68-3 TaxID=3391835 RepID=UPI0039C8F0E7